LIFSSGKTRRTLYCDEEIQPKIFDLVRFETYPELKNDLISLLKKDGEDYWIAVDVRDLGRYVDGTTELATNNPSDFDDDVVRKKY